MPLLGFTKLKSKLLDGSKTQTIRKPRKHPIRVGDKLYIYWKLRTKDCEKLGEGIVINIEQKTLLELTEKDAINDGFEQVGVSTPRNNLLIAFAQMYPSMPLSTIFDIITWRWTTKLWEI